MISFPLNGISLVLAGLSLACWPSAPPRLAATLEPSPRKSSRGLPSRWPALRWLVPVAVAWPLAGPGAAVAAGVLTVAFRQEWQSRRRAAAAFETVSQTATALRTMVAELRAGAHPVVAAEAAAEAVPAIAAELRALAESARLDVEPSGTPVLAGAWTLARRFGLPIADVLEASRRDVEANLAYTRRMRAKLAGPRASAAILTGLPVLCLLMGEATGAAPLHVLTTTLAGQVLLVVGALFLWAGTTWCRKLTGEVGPR